MSARTVQDLDAPIQKGIDGIYEFSSPPPKYVITEVKMNTTGAKGWKPKLDTKVTGSGGSQMTDAWIKYNLDNSLDSSTMLDVLDNGFESVLIGVSKDKVVVQSLNKNAKTVPNNINILTNG